MRKIVPVLIVCFTTLMGTQGALAQSARPAPRRAPAASAAPATPSVTGVVDVNGATEEQLQLLPGIGPAKARAIVATRQRLGRFRRIEDLLRVRGIGRVTLRRLRPMLTLAGGTTMSARPSRVRDRTIATSGEESGGEAESSE